MRVARLVALLGAVGLAVSGIAAPSDQTVSQMRWQRRVLIVSAAGSSDPKYQAQLQAIASWRGAEERDVTVVRIEGNLVSGSRDTAQGLRDRYELAADLFSATLIGKDGHVALRSEKPLPGARLEEIIDAMPMRRAGER